jgi:hypothetical protein
LDRLSGSAATLRSNGKRWILNACRSFLLAEDLVEIDWSDETMLIAGAGPTLEETLDLIDAGPRDFRIIAVSSALAALRARGFEPDLVVATDSGAWSRTHLYPLAGLPRTVASPLSALPSASLSCPLLLLDQGGFPESELSAALGPCRRLPSHGTVTGSALALASRLGQGPIVVAGFDFAAPPSRSHARPHGFDEAILAGEGRLHPGESKRWERFRLFHPEGLAGGEWRSSRSLAAYAAALDSDASRLGRPIHRLSPSPVRLAHFADMDAGGFARLVRGAPSRRRPPRQASILAADRRVAFLRNSIAEWDRRTAMALVAMEGGLGPDPRIVDLFRCVDLPDFAAAKRALSAGTDAAPAFAALKAAVLEFLDELRWRLLP